MKIRYSQTCAIRTVRRRVPVATYNDDFTNIRCIALCDARARGGPSTGVAGSAIVRGGAAGLQPMRPESNELGAPRILKRLDEKGVYAGSPAAKRRSRRSSRLRAAQRRAHSVTPTSQRRLPSLETDGWPDPGLESFARGDVPMWTEVAVPRPKTFNRDGRLHTPDWHRTNVTAAGGVVPTGADRRMLMTPYSASLHEQFIDTDSPAVQADLRRRSAGTPGENYRRHTTGSASLYQRSEEESSAERHVRHEFKGRLAPLDRSTAAPSIKSLMKQQGTYVTNFIRQPTNAQTFLASEMQVAKGSEANGQKSRSRGQSYRLLAGTLLQASFQDQVSVLDREIQKQNYIRHIPHSLEPTMHHAALTIQCGWRGYLTRQYVKLLNKSATKVQALWRGHRHRKRLRVMHSAATRIQRRFRTQATRRWFCTVRAGVITIQCGWRCFCARQLVADKRATRDGVILLLRKVIDEAAELAERNAAKRRALRLARELAEREAKAKKKLAVKSLLEKSKFGPVSCAITAREEWDGYSGNPIKIEWQVSTLDLELSYSEHVRQVFDTMDVDGNGTLDRGEISQLGEAIMGETMTEQQLNVAMAVMDADGSGGVDFEEFLRWWMGMVKMDEPSSPQPSPSSVQTSSGKDSGIFAKFFGARRSGGEGGGTSKSRPTPVKPPPMQHSDDVVRRLFDKMDADGSNSLDRTEVANLAKVLGTDVDDELDLDAAMAVMDADGNGSVEFEEFRDWYQKFVAEAEESMESGVRKFFNSLSPKKRREKQAMTDDANRSMAQTIFDSIDSDDSGQYFRLSCSVYRPETLLPQPSFPLSLLSVLTNLLKASRTVPFGYHTGLLHTH